MVQIMGVELHVMGSVPRGGPMLVVSNHVSWLDILVINAVSPARFVSKSDVKHWPLLGELISAAGTLFIERDKRRDAMRVVHHMADSLREGDVVAVFPEGTTGSGQTLLPFHANLLQAAISTDSPVKPVALTYLDSATGLPSAAPVYVGDTSLLASIWRTLNATGVQARVTFGLKELSEGRDRRTWAAHLRADIQTLLDGGVPSEDTRPASLEQLDITVGH
ncbi:MAG: 1-acyl-sn-glycerol-3-phosphate acyltransferase [Burkholderiales bacterium]|nr:1-acyl-sn-glycerol-3-phosphate acyltransferase [Burkholderiales bacterium]